VEILDNDNLPRHLREFSDHSRRYRFADVECSVADTIDPQHAAIGGRRTTNDDVNVVIAGTAKPVR